MTPTRQQLQDADCLFATDRVRDKSMTEFKQTARHRQHLWGKAQGVIEYGGHKNPRALDVTGQPMTVPNGTKLRAEDAERGINFLSEEICEVVDARLSAAGKQKHETLNPIRLRGDLLSSMPMAFNLFAEASAHSESKQALANLMAPGSSGPVTIEFEWSPGRRSPDYTRDRTAFDVAVRIGSGPQTVVGIETKYHEHSLAEAKPKAENMERHLGQTDFLARIADESGVFVDSWRDAILQTDLRQIWRDHLLALSMRRHSNLWGPGTRYVLIYPARNVSFAKAAERYREVLAPRDQSFDHLTIEEVVDSAFAHGGSTKPRFIERYLW